MTINKITPEQRELMKQKSAQSLPDVPSSKGWTPKNFKNAITKPLFDNQNSFISEINRIVEETNFEFENKLDIQDEKVYNLDTTFNDNFEFANSCIEYYKENGSNKIYFGNISTSNGKVQNTYRCVGLITSSRHKIGQQILYSYKVLIIRADGLIEVNDGESTYTIIASRAYVENFTSEEIRKALENLNYENLDYKVLENKPSINNVVLEGNKSLQDIGVSTISQLELEALLD